MREVTNQSDAATLGFDNSIQRVDLMARRFTLCVWLLALLIMLGAICFAWMDKSWEALGMAIVFAPIANAILLFGSLIVLAVL